jgi:hypothetical protein|uniref:Uncharacterized protein n=1 Tax=viral metagenome TaxID=1070528 RepID=A0A6C0DWZ1_9ZZZZ
MRLFKNQFLNVLFVILAFSLILLSLNFRITAYKNGEHPPRRLLGRILDTYFSK